MTSITRKDAEYLEKLYMDIYAEASDDESDEGDEVDAAIELANKKDEMDDKGKKVPQELQQVFQKADQKLKNVANKLND